MHRVQQESYCGYSHEFVIRIHGIPMDFLTTVLSMGLTATLCGILALLGFFLSTRQSSASTAPKVKFREAASFFAFTVHRSNENLVAKFSADVHLSEANASAK